MSEQNQDQTMMTNPEMLRQQVKETGTRGVFTHEAVGSQNTEFSNIRSYLTELSEALKTPGGLRGLFSELVRTQVGYKHLEQEAVNGSEHVTEQTTKISKVLVKCREQLHALRNRGVVPSEQIEAALNLVTDVQAQLNRAAEQTLAYLDVIAKEAATRQTTAPQTLGSTEAPISREPRSLNLFRQRIEYMFRGVPQALKYAIPTATVAGVAALSAQPTQAAEAQPLPASSNASPDSLAESKTTNIENEVVEAVSAIQGLNDLAAEASMMVQELGIESQVGDLESSANQEINQQAGGELQPTPAPTLVVEVPTQTAPEQGEMLPREEFFQYLNQVPIELSTSAGGTRIADFTAQDLIALNTSIVPEHVYSVMHNFSQQGVSSEITDPRSLVLPIRVPEDVFANPTPEAVARWMGSRYFLEISNNGPFVRQGQLPDGRIVRGIPSPNGTYLVGDFYYMDERDLSALQTRQEIVDEFQTQFGNELLPAGATNEQIQVEPAADGVIVIRYDNQDLGIVLMDKFIEDGAQYNAQSNFINLNGATYQGVIFNEAGQIQAIQTPEGQVPVVADAQGNLMVQEQGVEVVDASMSIRREAAMATLPPVLQERVNTGELVYDDEDRGFVDPQTGYVWRTGMSPENRNVEQGFVASADEYIFDPEGHNIHFYLEIDPDGITPRRYTQLEFAQAMEEKFPGFFERYLANSNLDGKHVYIQFAGEYNQNEAHRDYIQTLWENSTRDGTIMIATQSTMQDQDTILIRVYTDSRNNPADVQEQYDEYYLSQLLVQAMIVLRSGQYRTGEDISSIGPDRYPATNQIFGDLLYPLVNGPNMSLDDFFALRLVDASNPQNPS